MIINFVSWSPLISLIAISLLYPLRLHIHGSLVSRVYAAILLFPAFVSSLYLLKLTCYNGVIISKIAKIPMASISWGFQFSWSNSVIVTSINLLIIILIFFLPQKKTVENISLLSVIFIFLYIMSIAPDQLIKMSAFSVGSMLFTFMLLYEESDKNAVKHMMADFLLYRACDLLAFISLMIVLTKQKSLIMSELIVENHVDILPIFSYFLSIVFNLASLITFNTNQSISPYTLVRYSILRRVFIGSGSQILLLQFSPLLLRYNESIMIFIFPSIIILSLALLTAILYQNINIVDNLFNILISIGLITICTGYSTVTVVIICSIFTLYPIMSLPTIFKANAILHPSQAPKSAYLNLIPSVLNAIIFQFPLKISYFFAKIFINFLNPIYAGFLLYRVPTIVIGIVQTPLRLFHNGNIQRSLIFVILLLVGYIYWWGQQ
jgi:hypothetical protein